MFTLPAARVAKYSNYINYSFSFYSFTEILSQRKRNILDEHTLTRAHPTSTPPQTFANTHSLTHSAHTYLHTNLNVHTHKCIEADGDIYLNIETQLYPQAHA